MRDNGWQIIGKAFFMGAAGVRYGKSPIARDPGNEVAWCRRGSAPTVNPPR